MALMAKQHRRLPSALAFALKVCEKKHAEARIIAGETLVEIGMPAEDAEAVFASGEVATNLAALQSAMRKRLRLSLCTDTDFRRRRRVLGRP